jgi:hypothetical protein
MVRVAGLVLGAALAQRNLQRGCGGKKLLLFGSPAADPATAETAGQLRASLRQRSEAGVAQSKAVRRTRNEVIRQIEQSRLIRGPVSGGSLLEYLKDMNPVDQEWSEMEDPKPGIQVETRRRDEPGE